MVEHTVELSTWRGKHPTTGEDADRWSLAFEGNTLATFDSEDAARHCAASFGWQVRETGDGL